MNTWIQYAPHGDILAFSRSNSLTHTEDFNNRLQLVQSYESLGNVNSAASMLYALCPQWGSGGPTIQPIKICPGSPSAANNGNLIGYAEYIGGFPGASKTAPLTQPTFTQSSISYDGVNRLQGITDSGGWSRSFLYDQWGNMTESGTGPGLNINTPHGDPASSYNAKNQRSDFGQQG